MTRQEVEAGIAASEARSAALFARLDERTQATVLRFEAMLQHAVESMERAAENCEASAQRAEQHALRAAEHARHADEAAQRASHASLAYFISLIAVGLGLYFGIRQSNREMFEAYLTATRAEVHAANATIAGAERELDRQRDEVIRLKLEADRKAGAPPSAPQGKQR